MSNKERRFTNRLLKNVGGLEAAAPWKIAAAERWLLLWRFQNCHDLRLDWLAGHLDVLLGYVDVDFRANAEFALPAEARSKKALAADMVR